MRKLRFNIASLLVTILVLGVGFAALRESTDLWESGVFTLTIAVMLISILLAVHHTESRRSFWTGFSLFGWVYLGLSLVPTIESRLITTKGLDFIDSKMPLRPIVITGQAWGDVPGNQNVKSVTFFPQGANVTPIGNEDGLQQPFDLRMFLWGRSGTSLNFVRVGHSLLTLFLAWLGGHLSRYFSTKEQHRRSGLVPSPVPASKGSGA
jgi:hypothetical protein